MLNININNHFYNYVLDIIDTKNYMFKQITPKKKHKYISIIKVDNKGLEDIRVRKMLNHPNIIQTPPYNLQGKEIIPTVTYKQGNTVRNKILNYKDVVNSICIDEDVSFSLNANLCDCERSYFSIHITSISYQET